jgi:peroxiredoxin
MARQATGNTCVSCGLNAAVASIQNAISTGLFNAPTKIIDISTDGIDNVTNVAAVQTARNNAASQGIHINALAIEGLAGTNVTDYYNNNVITPKPMPLSKP